MLSRIWKEQNIPFLVIYRCDSKHVHKILMYMNPTVLFQKLGLQLRMCHLGFPVGWETERAGKFCEKQEFGTVLWWWEGNLGSGAGEKGTWDLMVVRREPGIWYWWDRDLQNSALCEYSGQIWEPEMTLMENSHLEEDGGCRKMGCVSCIPFSSV